MSRLHLNRRAFFLGGAGATALLTIPARARSADTPAADPSRLLNEQTQRALRWAGKAPADWVRPRAGVDHNVVIVGGGQSGLSIAYALRRKGIGRIALIDKSEPGNAGIWRNIARMNQLRTPKWLPGPEQGNPDLGFRAWYETLQGAPAYDALERIPRTAWADYLSWFEKITDANVSYRTRLVDIEPQADVLRLHLESGGVPRTETTRKLVLANGFAGAGGANVPGLVGALPARLWSHTDVPFDFETLAGKVVAVVGAGASAFDAAATALEHRAAQVHMYSRRSYIDYPVPGAAGPAAPDRGHANVIELACELPDEVRWRNRRLFENRVASVPLDSIRRAVAFKNFHIHLNSELSDVAANGAGKVVARISGHTRRFDHVVAATGYRVDLAAQPELARFHGSLALWKDRFHPPAGEGDAALEKYPYLGAGFQFLPRAEAGAEFLRNIHCFNLAASLSLGTLVGDIPSCPYHPRLAAAIARDLFVDDVDVAANERFIRTPLIAPDVAPYQDAVSPA